LRKAEPDARDAAAIFPFEVKIISMAEKQGRSNVKTIFIVFFDYLYLVIMSSHLKNQDLHLTVLWHL